MSTYESSFVKDKLMSMFFKKIFLLIYHTVLKTFKQAKNQVLFVTFTPEMFGPAISMFSRMTVWYWEILVLLLSEGMLSHVPELILVSLC